jgi:hypothetical protein
MAKWFVVSADGETLMKNDRDGSAETFEFDSGRDACSFAASFLIPFSEHVLPELTPDEARQVGEALEEKFGGDDEDPEENGADEDIAELEVVCLEKDVRIRMTREPLGVIANSREQ